MSEDDLWQMAEDYLARLDSGLTELPPGARRSRLEEVRAEIEVAWKSSPVHDQETMEGILEDLGNPEELAKRESERFGVARARPVGPGILSFLAIILFAAPLLFAFAWLPGLFLTWISRSWFTRDKVAATLIPIAGFALFMAVSYGATGLVPSVDGTLPTPTPTPVVAGSGSTGQADQLRDYLNVGLATFGLVGAPVVTSLYLGLRLRPRPRPWKMIFGFIAGFIVLFTLLTVLIGPTGSAEAATLRQTG